MMSVLTSSHRLTGLGQLTGLGDGSADSEEYSNDHHLVSVINSSVWLRIRIVSTESLVHTDS